MRRRSRRLRTGGKPLGFNSEEEKKAERTKRELQERSAQAQQAAAEVPGLLGSVADPVYVIRCLFDPWIRVRDG